MAAEKEKKKPLLMSLQTQCLTCVLHHLEDYPAEVLCSLPTRQRRQLLSSLPPLDVCRLEDTEVARDVDLNEVWLTLCRLYGETDNLRVTGKRSFDRRYLDYHKSGSQEFSLFDHNEKVKGDWRAYFLTRTAQILLHSFDPACLPIMVSHDERCDLAKSGDGSAAVTPEEGGADCDCWGSGVDPDHRTFLQRLMAVPPECHVAKCFLEMEQRARHFKDVWDGDNERRLLVPFRYADYFPDDDEEGRGRRVFALDLLSMLVRECRFQPVLLPVHCEFMYHSELYQLYLSGGVGPGSHDHQARALFVEFLSRLEQVEFYWMGGLRGGDGSFGTNPSLHVPGMVLEAALVSPAPKLDTIGLQVYAKDSFPYYVPNLDDCLDEIAPFFSPLHAKNSQREYLPLSTPYSGLKRLHLWGNITQDRQVDALTSLILHQSGVEGLELMLGSKRVSPNQLLDPLVSIFSHSQFRYLTFRRWRDCDMRDLFLQFVESNHTCEIHAVAFGHEIVIPVRSGKSLDGPPPRKHLCFSSRMIDDSYWVSS